MSKKALSAQELHKDVPPDWYKRSISENIFQRYWHNKRFSAISKLIQRVEGGNILDIGSADGTFSKVILDKSKADLLTGVDVLQTSVDWANRHWKKNKRLKFLVADAHKLPFKNDSFDAVFALEVLEHVHKPRGVLREIKRVLKRSGYAILLVPSESILFKIVWFLWHFSGRMVWKDTHLQSFRNDSLIRVTEQLGFKIETNHKFLLGMLQAVKIHK